MTPSVLAWIIAVLASFAAAVFFMWSRSLRAERDALAAELAEQKAEIESLAQRLENRTKDQKKRIAEIAELRTKLEKTKKRASDRNQNQHNAASQIHELEEALALEKSNVAELRAELRASGHPLPRARKKVAPAPPAESKPSAPKIDPDKLAALKHKLDARSKEIKEVTKQLTTLTEELAAAKKSASREKSKRETLDKAYAQLRGELEIRKDELRAQRAELERLRALKVTLSDQSNGTQAAETEVSVPDAQPTEPAPNVSPEPK